MRGWLVTAFALLGCTKQNPDFCPNHPDDPRCGGMADAGTDTGGTTDAEVDGGTGCFGSGAFEACPMGAATGTVTLTGALDTTNGGMCSSMQFWTAAGQTDSCFIVAATVTIQNVTVTGSRPLVIVANEINVAGHLDAASHIATQTPTEGPGAINPGTCGTYGAPAMALPAGGGAGASFAADGGAGGDGGDGDNAANAGGTKYAPFLATPPGTLRAGCRGQQGQAGQGSGGVGGFGGGAVYLAASQITLGASAIINASGAGGGAGAKTAGGGGGGSGGMIILHAPEIAITSGAIVVANGGSGGTGGDGNGNGTGTRGNDPDPTNPMTPAPGPTGAGGAGGAGFAIGSAATAGSNGLAGEAGGGGGAGGGYIQSNLPLTNATVSPAANVVP